MKTLGLRHAALFVKDPERSKEFYTKVLKMTLEWEPDPDNIYLTSGGHDNLALHRVQKIEGVGNLDHIGFAVPEASDVDEWYAHIRAHGVKIVKDIKTHRDGARSFYISDPDGVVIQIIHHPPISERSKTH